MEKKLLDYKVVVSFGMSRGHLETVAPSYMPPERREAFIKKHVAEKLAEKIAGSAMHILADQIETVSAEGGNREWKVELMVIPYDALVNLLE